MEKALRHVLIFVFAEKKLPLNVTVLQEKLLVKISHWYHALVKASFHKDEDTLWNIHFIAFNGMRIS